MKTDIEKQTPEISTTDIEKTRQRSTIAFPYGDLDDAVVIAKAVEAHQGLATMDQLAAYLEHDNVDSGAFRIKVSTARTFGVISIQDDKAALTDLGNQIVRPDTEARAKALAFMHVPLYKAIYDEYKGRLLPGNAALEQDMERLGVAPKQKARARQGFQRSAELAKLGKDRLVLPGGVSLDSKVPDGGASRKMETPHLPVASGELDPMLATLFEDLPPSGSEWPRDARDQWLRILQRTIDRVYKDKPE